MNKKTIISILALSALCSCTESAVLTSSSSESSSSDNSSHKELNLDTLLNALKSDIALTGQWTYEKTYENKQTSDVKTFIASDEYFFNVALNGQTIGTQHYFKNSEGKLVKKTVDQHNVVKEVVQTVSNTDEYDRILKNPFSFMDTSMMTLNENVVAIDAAKAVGASTIGNLIYSMLVNSIAEVEEVKIQVSDDSNPTSINITTRKNSDGEIFTYNGSFTTKEELNIPTYPYPSQGDKTLLTNALNKLKAGNYTYKVYSSAVNNGQSPNMVGKVTSEGVFSNTYDASSNIILSFGFIDEPTGKYLTEVEAVKDDSNKIKGTKNFWKDKTFAKDKLPSADFSVDLFKELDGNYYLLPGDYQLADLLPHAMCSDLIGFQSNSLMFNISSDLSKITYSYNASALIGGGIYKVTVEITDFGTTEFPYNLATDYIPYEASASKWSEVSADGNGVTGFNEMFPNGDIDRDIPFYTTEKGKFTYFGSFGNKFEVDITYESENDVSWDLDYGYIDMFSGITSKGWTDITPVEPSEGIKGVYTKDQYKLTIKGEAEFFGSGYVIYIYIEPNSN